jgi:hypothetical protein
MTHAYQRFAAAGSSVWLDDRSRPRITSGDLARIIVAARHSDDVERTKPALDIFAMALAKLSGIDAKKALVVGDTPYDIETAGSAELQSSPFDLANFPTRCFERLVSRSLILRRFIVRRCYLPAQHANPTSPQNQ